MRNPASFFFTLSTVADALRGRDWARFLEIDALPKWLPLLLGLVLGFPLAYLLVQGLWQFAFVLILLVPTALLFIRYPFATVILWLLVSPLVMSSPTVQSRHAYWIIHRAMIPVGLGIVVLSRMLKIDKYVPVRLGPAELAMGLFAGLVPASILLFQADVVASLIVYYDRILMPYFMYLLVRLVILREKDMMRLLVAAFVMAVSQSIIGLLSWFAPQALPSLWLRLEGARTVGSLVQPAVYTSALVFAMALLFQAAMTRKPALLRSAFLAAFGLGAICVFLSLSRGSWLGALFVAVGLLVLFPKPTLGMAAVLLLVLAVLGSGVLSRQFSFTLERLWTVHTVQSRIAYSDALLTMIQLKPFFGWGYENEGRYALQFIPQAALVGDLDMGSHNTYLTILAEMGLVGSFFYLFPFAYWLIQSIKALPLMPRKGFLSRSLLILLWLIIANHIVVSFFIDMRYFPFGLTLWWLTLGLVANVVFAHLDPGRQTGALLTRGTP